MNLRHTKFIVLMFSFITFISSFSFAEVDTNTFKGMILQKKSISEGEISDYSSKIKDLDLDNWTLKSEQEWVDQKILSIEDQGRPVPEDLLISKSLFDKKISLNNKKIKRYKTLLISHIRELKMLDRKVVEHFSGKRPKWWKIVPKKRKGSASSNVENVSVESITVENIDSVSVTDLQKNIVEEIHSKGLNKDWVELTTVNSGLVMKMSLPILFGSGKTDVKPYYKKVFTKLASVIKKHRVFVTVEGFTDPKKIRTQIYPSNLQLGAGRAASVVAVFVKSGMKPSKFTIISRGKYGSNTMSDAKRRRAVVTIYFKDQMGNMSEKRIKSEGINYLRISG
ncbi:MAG: OmpA family protein [Desulfobacterales bacterium]|nr:OmpA family protein [Desulfobacterales bacterium]